MITRETLNYVVTLVALLACRQLLFQSLLFHGSRVCWNGAAPGPKLQFGYVVSNDFRHQSKPLIVIHVHGFRKWMWGWLSYARPGRRKSLRVHSGRTLPFATV